MWDRTSEQPRTPASTANPRKGPTSGGWPNHPKHNPGYPRSRLCLTDVLSRDGRQLNLSAAWIIRESGGLEMGLLRFKPAIAPELQSSAILRDCSHNIVGYACGDVRIDIEGDLHV